MKTFPLKEIFLWQDEIKVVWKKFSYIIQCLLVCQPISDFKIPLQQVLRR